MVRRLNFTSPSRSVLLGALVVVLVAAGCGGIVFAALQGSILGVALAALLPGSYAVALLLGG
jgi:hypothetical protein